VAESVYVPGTKVFVVKAAVYGLLVLLLVNDVPLNVKLTLFTKPSKPGFAFAAAVKLVPYVRVGEDVIVMLCALQMLVIRQKIIHGLKTIVHLRKLCEFVFKTKGIYTQN
jgi:hypothetical protein